MIDVCALLGLGSVFQFAVPGVFEAFGLEDYQTLAVVDEDSVFGYSCACHTEAVYTLLGRREDVGHMERAHEVVYHKRVGIVAVAVGDSERDPHAVGRGGLGVVVIVDGLLSRIVVAVNKPLYDREARPVGGGAEVEDVGREADR